MTRQTARKATQRLQDEIQQERRKQLDAVNRLREWAYLEGQKIARKLYSTIQRFKCMPSPDDQPHQAEFDAARGFADGLNLALDDVRNLVPADSRRHFLEFLIDDLARNAKKAEHVMGDVQVSPWVIHAEKLRSNDANGRRLETLTIGLYRQYEPFDAGRCLTGLDEDFRAAAIEMIESFSRLGRRDRAFMDAAETLLRGGEA